MNKYTLKQLKNMVKIEMAKDITNYTTDQVEELKKSGWLRQVGYSAGLYGCNGMLLQHDSTKELYAIIGRVGILWLF